MKKRKLLVIFSALFSFIALLNMSLTKIQKTNDLSSLKNIIAEAKADGESVTCNYDPGDTCIVGTTKIEDYDEGCATIFWG